MLTSSELGFAEPHPEAFAQAPRRLGDPALTAVVMVGESLTKDGEGARTAGLRGVLLDRLDRHPGVGVERIRRLSEPRP